ncbi:MAG: zinc transporter [Ilumatobacteraceae bacterium]
MLTVVIVVGVVSASLVVGAVWGAALPLPDRVRGDILAFAGGALITSIAFELIEPAIDDSGVRLAAIGLMVGAVVFTVIDYLIDERWDSSGGGGILAAVTTDGIPENLALGVALIGTTPSAVAALAAAILASNLPEAAGGAADLMDDGWSKVKVIGLWTVTAVILSIAAVAGYFFLEGASDTLLSFIRAFAAGAVLASLATEVFPQAFRAASHETGIATAAGFVLTFILSEL